jgi:hypothetical protein
MELEKRFKELLYCLGERDWNILTDEAWDKYINQDTPFNEKQMDDLKHFVLNLLGGRVEKSRFVIEWRRSPDYGVGFGEDYYITDSEDEALKLFWWGKNKEAYDITNVTEREI